MTAEPGGPSNAGADVNEQETPMFGKKAAAGGGTRSVPWARQTTARAAERATARLRRSVLSLPEWDPLPPGEAVVRRPRQL